MSVNIKLGNNILSNVDSVRFEDADTQGQYDVFPLYKEPIDPDADVLFYDYDGTILYGYSKEEFLALTEMPANPTHEGLTAQGWNYTLADAKEYVADCGILDIGQMYITDDGKTRLYVSIAEAVQGRMSPTLYFSQTVANGVTIDWGDNSDTETVAGTGNVNITHTYVAIGDYVITLFPNEGCILGLGSGNYGSPVIDGLYSYANWLKKVYIGQSVSLSQNYVFNMCRSLEIITIPNNTAFSGTSALEGCSSLKSITLPNGTTTIPSRFCAENASLMSITIPRGITLINGSAFFRATSLKRITVPKTTTQLGTQVFADCYSLQEATMFVDSINKETFREDHALKSVKILSNKKIIINEDAFNECTRLSRVQVDNISSIGNTSFSSCKVITQIKITMTSSGNIGRYAFSDNSSMAVFDFTDCAVVPTLVNYNAFTNIPADCQILVPASLYETWKAATNWSTLASHIISA